MKKPASPQWALLRTQMKTAYSFRGLAEQFGLRKASKFAYAILAFVAISFIPLLSQLYSVAKLLSEASAFLGQPGLPVVAAVTSAQILIAIVGVSSVMGVLYHAGDMETLLALPLSGRQIIQSKLLVVYVSQALVAAFASGPFFLALGRTAPFPGYWLSAFLVQMSIPGIPLALSVLFSVLLARATKGFRKKEAIQVVLSLFFLAFFIAFQSLGTSLATGGMEQAMEMLAKHNGVIQAAARYYPPLAWAAYALSAPEMAQRLLGLVSFVGVSLGAVVVTSAVSERMFLESVGKEVRTDAAPRRGRARAATLSRPRSPGMAILVRDHLTLIRTSNFLLVSLTNMMILPLMVFLGRIQGGGALPWDGVGQMPEVIALIIIGANGLMVSANQVASTCLSREGKGFWYSKVIPVSPKDQIKGKFLYCLLPAFIQTAMAVLTARFAFHLPAPYLLAVGIGGVLISLPMTGIAMLVDLHMPKIDWDNPHMAMKGNFGTLVAMLSAGALLVPLGLVVSQMWKRGFGFYQTLAFSLVVSVVSGILLLGVLGKIAESRYVEIEL